MHRGGPAPGTYEIDPVHSSVEFVSRYAMLSRVRGRFGVFSGTLHIDEDPARSWADVLLLCWFPLLLTSVRQTYAWYPLAMVPWLCAPPRIGNRLENSSTTRPSCRRRAV